MTTTRWPNRRPPYGREFSDARRAGQPINPWVLAGRDAWRAADKRGPGRLVLPSDAVPSDFDWSLVAGLDVVVRWPDASVAEVDDLGVTLVRSGARSVTALPDIRPEGTSYWELRQARRYVRRRYDG